jgi:hypothetical protein
MDLAHFRPGPRHLAGFFGVKRVTRLLAQRLSHFLACGLPHLRVVPFLLAGALGLPGASFLMGAICPPLLIAGPRRGAGCLAQPRRRAKQIGFDLAFDIAVAAAMMAAVMTTMAAPGIALAAALVTASIATLVVLALRIRLRFRVAGLQTGAAVLTAARRII